MRKKLFFKDEVVAMFMGSPDSPDVSEDEDYMPEDTDSSSLYNIDV